MASVYRRGVLTSRILRRARSGHRRRHRHCLNRLDHLDRHRGRAFGVGVCRLGGRLGLGCLMGRRRRRASGHRRRSRCRPGDHRSHHRRCAAARGRCWEPRAGAGLIDAAGRTAADRAGHAAAGAGARGAAGGCRWGRSSRDRDAAGNATGRGSGHVIDHGSGHAGRDRCVVVALGCRRQVRLVSVRRARRWREQAMMAARLAVDQSAAARVGHRDLGVRCRGACHDSHACRACHDLRADPRASPGPVRRRCLVARDSQPARRPDGSCRRSRPRRARPARAASGSDHRARCRHPRACRRGSCGAAGACAGPRTSGPRSGGST